MPWYLVPYRFVVDSGKKRRECQAVDFTVQILANGGKWGETEVLGNMAIVKVVRASAATLSSMDSAYTRIPASALDDPLSSLTDNQKTAIRNKVLSLGYTAQEVQDALGSDLGAITLGQLMRFVATRRLRPRYDAGSNSIILDGQVEGCKSVDLLNAEIA